MKKIIIIAIIALLLLGGGGFAAWKIFGHHGPVQFDAKTYASLTDDIGEIKTNLHSNGNYIVASFQVQLQDAKSKEEFDARLPEAKEVIILTLASTDESALKGKDGIVQLQNSILKQYNSMLHDGHKVSKVMVTDWITQ